MKKELRTANKKLERTIFFALYFAKEVHIDWRKITIVTCSFFSSSSCIQFLLLSQWLFLRDLVRWVEEVKNKNSCDSFKMRAILFICESAIIKLRGEEQKKNEITSVKRRREDFHSRNAIKLKRRDKEWDEGKHSLLDMDAMQFHYFFLHFHAHIEISCFKFFSLLLFWLVFCLSIFIQTTGKQNIFK